jgi:hypothetical protein
MMKAEKKADNIIAWNATVKSIFTVHTLHISDVHFDSAHCDREMLKRHLDQIKACEGQVFIYGDWFDVMGCHQDPRSKAADIRPEYIQRGKEYLNLVVDDSLEFLRPYAANIAFISEGNHETEIRKRRDVDILGWFTSRLRDMGSNVMTGHYSGWNVFRFSRLAGVSRRTILTHYHHGYGGNAKRSKGMLDAQIATFQYPDADIIFRGHDHMKFHDPSNVKFRFDRHHYTTHKVTSHYVKTGSYKDGVGEGLGGWEVQKGFAPTRLGGWFIDFEASINTKSRNMEVDFTIREAT